MAGHQARAGRRVVAFGVARGRVDADQTPVIDEPLGLVVLGERLRADVCTIPNPTGQQNPGSQKPTAAPPAGPQQAPSSGQKI